MPPASFVTPPRRGFSVQAALDQLQQQHSEGKLSPAVSALIVDASQNITDPTPEQLAAIRQSRILPWAAFGFCDNMIMLLAGDFIDAKLEFLGLSSIGAAGVGNIVSDSVGLSAVFLVGSIASGGGSSTKGGRYAAFQGRVIGLVGGALLGLVPLAWPDEWRLWEGGAAVKKK